MGATVASFAATGNEFVSPDEDEPPRAYVRTQGVVSSFSHSYAEPVSTTRSCATGPLRGVICSLAASTPDISRP